MLLTLVLSLGFVGCAKPPLNASPPAPGPAPTGSASSWTAFLAKASDSEIRERAVAEAQKDTRAGTPHVGWCGSIAVYRPNIPADKERFVAGLPSLNLPVGCTNPLAEKGQIFATAYNGELVKHLPIGKAR